MFSRLVRSRAFKLFVPGASLLLLGQCPLTDAQITAITQSAISTALNSAITQFLSGLLGTTTGAG
ncbi:MAG: hypothetical protein HZB38_01245 [Planctomycetes bacterium]|nr:hypothetical protein [Planctomycetota bacterium]